LTELVAQLQITTENEIDSKQAELLINRLSNKLNETKAQIKQVYQMLQQALKPKDNTEVSQLHSTLAAKAASKEITTENAVKNVETPDENQQIQKLDTDNATDTRDSKDNKHNKDGNESAYKQSDESHYKANEKNEVKQVTLVDKLNQSDVNGAVAPQVENENFQLNIKQANANLQKENLVKFSKSDIINQVIKKADIFVQGSHQEMVMKLEPESLGKINLKIIVENGLITAKFVAESQQVKEVLESSFNQLKDALQEKGISVQGFSVSVGQQGAEFNSGKGLGQWKQTIKLNSKVAGEYMGLDEENIISINPYSYHEGKIDYRA
jgi:flagellar hook-length control protein FliK